ncbi:hypothetical protein B0A50_00120 [Salinomyces thailandicus]|uniref:FAD dependent oxidoreductase domain-containing protein n=1 Tax=Salinomyces thailandicus TaxID=706561 RepID=A0A4U0UF19_9PEZI|nr:hypothetical protein B0A50_00120 [Salinomyces thailandica]
MYLATVESATTSHKDDAIITVGASILGLSTSIHLAARGCRNVTVFDKQPYDHGQHSYFAGADAASADIKKIIGSVYGGVSIYQDPSLEAIERWKAWNDGIARGEILPAGFSRDDRQQAFEVTRRFIADHLLELKQEGIGLTTTRVCWRNDSFDDHLLIDRVPKTEGLMVATAGSGHAFKYFPVIGRLGGGENWKMA